MTVAHFDPAPYVLRRKARRVPGWAVALAVVSYSGLAWAAIFVGGAALLERAGASEQFAPSHRG